MRTQPGRARPGNTAIARACAAIRGPGHPAQLRHTPAPDKATPGPTGTHSTADAQPGRPPEHPANSADTSASENTGRSAPDIGQKNNQKPRVAPTLQAAKARRSWPATGGASRSG